MKRQTFRLGSVLRYYVLQKQRTEIELRQASRLLREVDDEIEALASAIVATAALVHGTTGGNLTTTGWIACYRKAESLDAQLGAGPCPPAAPSGSCQQTASATQSVRRKRRRRCSRYGAGWRRPTMMPPPTPNRSLLMKRCCANGCRLQTSKICKRSAQEESAMSRMIKFFSVAVVLFSVAAVASWYLQGQQTPPEGEEAPVKHAAEHPRAKATGHEAPTPRLLPRTTSSPEADRFTQLAATLQAQQDALKNREQHVVVREKQLDLIHEDIKKDQKKLDAVRKEVEGELQLVQEKLDLLEKRTGEGAKDREKTEAQLEELRRATLEVTDLESKNLKQVAGIYDKMDPEAAAQNIQQMTEKGALDTAVTILANMRDRQAANLLGELSKLDAGIAAQVFERMRLFENTGEDGER